MRSVTIAVVCLGLILGAGWLISHASSSEHSAPTSTVASLAPSWSLHQAAASPAALPLSVAGRPDYGFVAAPITKDGDTVGYNVYLVHIYKARVYAWLYGDEPKLVRISLADE